MKGTSPSRARRGIAAIGNELPRWEVLYLINSLKGGESMAIVTLGVDLAKNVFALHGVDATGRAILVRPNVARAKLLELGLTPALPHRQ
jgi:transposase